MPDGMRVEETERGAPDGPAAVGSPVPDAGAAARRPGSCQSCDVAREFTVERVRVAGWLAHELRNPLNCILGYAELLCDQLASADRTLVLADAERVRDLALHQIALLEDVLDLAWLAHGSVPFQTRPVDGTRVLGNVAAAALPLVQKGGNSLYLSVDSQVWVLADETRLRQVLLNLVGNAAKFTRDGVVALGATSHDGSVSLHVRDTGRGMTPEEAERVFRPFTQANASVASEHGGSGLGLAISRELCERMGGSISLLSAVGEGTTFTVTLPAAAPPGPFVRESASA